MDWWIGELMSRTRYWSRCCLFFQLQCSCFCYFWFFSRLNCCCFFCFYWCYFSVACRKYCFCCGYWFCRSCGYCCFICCCFCGYHWYSCYCCFYWLCYTWASCYIGGRIWAICKYTKRSCSSDVNNQSWIYDFFFFTKMSLFIFKDCTLPILEK